MIIMLIFDNPRLLYIVILQKKSANIEFALDKVIIIGYNYAVKEEYEMSLFSERISKLMKENNFSQKELAAKIGVTESAMSYYIKGTRTPRSDVLSRVATALNTSTDYLLGKSNNPAVQKENCDLQYLQRNLRKMDEEQLKRAETILKAAFNDIFNDDEDEE